MHVYSVDVHKAPQENIAKIIRAFVELGWEVLDRNEIGIHQWIRFVWKKEIPPVVPEGYTL